MSTQPYFPPPPTNRTPSESSDDARSSRDRPRFSPKKIPLVNTQNSQSNLSNVSVPGNKPHIFRPWILEILSLGGALLMIVAVFVFLSQYDNHPSPNWPYYITINSIISIFTTVLKGLMLLAVAESISQLKWIWFESGRALVDLDRFDQASRGGPWGSSRLIYHLQARHFAALGAFITIIAVGIDPFAQQAIQYRQCWQSSPANATAATIPISRNFHGFQGSDKTSMQDIGLLGGLFDGTTIPNGNNTAIQAACPSGRCEFSTHYQTLGVCSKCINMSKKVFTNFSNQTVNVSTSKGNQNFTCRVEFPSFNMSVMVPDQDSSVPQLYTLSLPLAIENNVAMNFSLIQTYTTGLSGWRPSWLKPDEKNLTDDSLSHQVGATGLSMATFVVQSITNSENCDSGFLESGNFTENDCFSAAHVHKSKHLDTDPERPYYIHTGQVNKDKCNVQAIDEALKAGAPLPAAPGTGSDDPIIYTFPGMSYWPHLITLGCEMTLCAKTYEAKVTDGVLNETLVREDALFEFIDKAAPHNDLSPMSGKWTGSISIDGFVPRICTLNGTDYKLEDMLNLTAIQIDDLIETPKNRIHFTADARNRTFIEQHLFNKTLFDQCTLRMDEDVENTLIAFLPVAMNHAGLIGDPYRFTPSPKRPDIIEPWQNSSTIVWESYYWMAAFANNGKPTVASVSQVFDTVSRALTNHMRIQDGEGSLAHGMLWTQDSCVTVVWPWLTLPLVLVVLSVIFLIITMVQTHRKYGRGRIVWKSSQLPLLFTGLSHEMRREMAGVEHLDEMEKVGSKVRVKMTETAQYGWHLEGVEPAHKSEKRGHGRQQSAVDGHQGHPTTGIGYTPVASAPPRPEWI